MRENRARNPAHCALWGPRHRAYSARVCAAASKSAAELSLLPQRTYVLSNLRIIDLREAWSSCLGRVHRRRVYITSLQPMAMVTGALVQLTLSDLQRKIDRVVLSDTRHLGRCKVASLFEAKARAQDNRPTRRAKPSSCGQPLAPYCTRR